MPSRNSAVQGLFLIFWVLPPFSLKLSKNLFNFLVVFWPTNKFCFSSLKDPIRPSNRWGIYHIPCQCGLGYVGQTKRTLKLRVKEHKSCVTKQEISKSAIALHSWNCNHVFNFAVAKIICSPKSVGELDFLESCSIFTRSNSLINESTPLLSNAWKPLLTVSSN